MQKRTKEEAVKELALINGDYGAYFIDDNGVRRTQQEAIRIVTKDLLAIQDKAKLVLAEMLNKIYKEEYFNGWGHESFQDYCAKELDFEYRQAMYLVKIWDVFVNKRGIPVDVLRKSTWSKLKEIIKTSSLMDDKEELYLVDTKDIADLIEESTKLTVQEVQYKSKEMACEALGSLTTVERTHKVGFTLFEEQYENLKKALDCAAEVSTSEKPGANLDLICTAYLASYIPEDKPEELKRIATQLEKSTGAEIMIAFEGKVIYANKNLK